MTSTRMEATARRRWPKILVDSTLLIGFVAEFITREGPDYGLHSWIGIILVPVISVHLFSNASWIRRLIKNGRQDREFALGLLNVALGVLAATCILSGFPIWLEWSESKTWTGVHTATGFLSIIAMSIHLWRNKARIRKLLRA